MAIRQREAQLLVCPVNFFFVTATEEAVRDIARIEGVQLVERTTSLPDIYAVYYSMLYDPDAIAQEIQALNVPVIVPEAFQTAFFEGLKP